jgi:decaprenylphospho-beta-D-ribofuranose 2-oxidase
MNRCVLLYPGLGMSSRAQAVAESSESSVVQSTVHGWGRVGVAGVEVTSEDLERLTRDAVLSRGLGRSYGDSSLPPPSREQVVGTRLADRVLSFDDSTGVLRAEAGLALHEVTRLFLPRGWFVPVTPGTQFVTLGGMVASDVHGKNHHVDGCIGEHVRALRMRVASGDIVECSRDEHADLFRATLGGMGLTGHILEVEVTLARVPSPWIVSESVRVPNLDEFLRVLKESSARWPFTVGWVDCLTRGARMGRGIVISGRWAEPHEAPARMPRSGVRFSVPFVAPSWWMGPLSVRAFNTLYYHKHWRRVQRGVVTPQSFFYPLDAIADWNKLYGPNGLTQYQCVIPQARCPDGVRRMLEVLVERGGASFLSVIKDCGKQGTGLLSFPMAGMSIALDIAVRPTTQSLIDALNEQLLLEGGRMYLTKDQFTRPEHFAAMESRLDAWRAVRDAWDPAHAIRSAQSVRLFGDKP